MTAVDRPESVLEEETKHVGHNCVACVAAVLHNESSNRSFVTANMVAQQFLISPKFSLTVERAVQIFENLAGIRASPGNPDPRNPAAPEGHYAVFCLGRRHVIYGRRGPGKGFYLYDPQTERDQDFESLTRNGYGPFKSYHFAS